MAKVAVVGLGAMGSRIAARLLEKSNEVVVWNRDPAKGVALEAAGATAVTTPADAAGRAEAVITMVTDGTALRDVNAGPEGVVAGLEAGAVVIQMSTVAPGDVLHLASVLRDGAQLLDAPVLGSISEAETGTLKVFAGGDASLLERWTPLLESLGTVIPVGPVGAGTAAKLVANSTLVGVIGVLGEALALGEALGLSRDAAFDVLAVTALGAQAERRRQNVESNEFPVRFALPLARKDADLIHAAAEELGLDLRVAEAARTWLVDAEREDADRDYSAALSTILRLSRGRDQA